MATSFSADQDATIFFLELWGRFGDSERVRQVIVKSCIESFEPNDQDGGTCYANAIAAVFHFAMRRILGRKGGYPSFNEILDILIKKYGKDGAVIGSVLKEYAPKYRLRYEEINEREALEALTKMRPIVATFDLPKKQWDHFGQFYGHHKDGILEKSDIATCSELCMVDGCHDGMGNKKKKGYEGHAVVLTDVSSKCLKFLNSWGQDWADNGYFRVKDTSVLNLTFYDVYWTEDDLLEEEKEAYLCDVISNAIV